jgi:Protein of unknown function (DUF3553)
MSQEMLPGAGVRHSNRADWGVGQAQFTIWNRVAVNFEHAGEPLIDAEIVALVVLSTSGQVA